MKTGDIILFKTNDFLGKIIKHIEKCEYTHAGIYYGKINNREFIADALGWWVDLRPLDMINKTDYDIFRVPDLKYDKEYIQKRIIDNIGKYYDYKALLGLLIYRIILNSNNYFNNKNKLFCSEFVSYVLYPYLGKKINNIMPKDIHNLYLEGKLIKGE